MSRPSDPSAPCAPGVPAVVVVEAPLGVVAPAHPRGARVTLIGYDVQRNGVSVAAFADARRAQCFAAAVSAWLAAAPPDAPPDSWPPGAVSALARLCHTHGALRVADPALRAALALPLHR